MSYLDLDKKKTTATAKELNILLADYHVYYQKLRNFHWNVVGHNFFDLHNKFEEMYNDAKTKIDEIAERILTLRFQPTSNFSDYLKTSNIKEASENTKDMEMVKKLLEDHGKLLHIEKISWMLDAWSMKATDNHPEA